MNPEIIEPAERREPRTAAAAEEPLKIKRVAVDSGLECLALVLRLLGRAGDSARLIHQFGISGRSVDALTVLRAARRMGLKARIVESRWEALETTPRPVIAEMMGGKFVLLGTVQNGRIPVLDPASLDEQGKPRTASVDRAEFEDMWTGRLIVATTRATATGSDRPFSLAWFLPAVAKYRMLLIEVLVSSFVLQLFALASPLVFQVVIDKVLVHRSLSTLDVLVFALVVMALFEGLLGGVRLYIFSHTTNRVDVELGARLFSHLLALPLSYFEARQVGNSVARVRELENIRSFLTGNAITLVVDVVFTVAFLAVMFLYSPTLALIVVGSLPLYVLLSLVITPMLRRLLAEKFQRGAENQSFLVEAVTGIETLKAMAVEPQIQRRWEEQLAGYVSSAFRATRWTMVGSQIANVVNRLTTAATLWYGAKIVIAGDLSVGELVAFNMLAGNVSGPIVRLANLWQEFQQVRLSVDRLGDILNAPTEAPIMAARGAMPRLKGHIRLENVSFRYRPGGPPILSDISLDVPAGQILGIVGPSGSGKSTLTKLIQRLYTPEQGRLSIDGLDLALLDPAALRRQIGVVLQDSVLFTGTVRSNIALADPGMDIERVIHAAKLAGAHEFILDALQEGYDTQIGERGASLSGGQRQRIALARALAVNPRVLLFDEATSALDAESERIIHDNMKFIAAGRTVLIIAHRLSTVRHAHRIITLERGRIVEDGTQGELLERNGRFAALYRQQRGGH